MCLKIVYFMILAFISSTLGFNPRKEVHEDDHDYSAFHKHTYYLPENCAPDCGPNGVPIAFMIRSYHNCPKTLTKTNKNRMQIKVENYCESKPKNPKVFFY